MAGPGALAQHVFFVGLRMREVLRMSWIKVSGLSKKKWARGVENAWEELASFRVESVCMSQNTVETSISWKFSLLLELEHFDEWVEQHSPGKSGTISAVACAGFQINCSNRHFCSQCIHIIEALTSAPHIMRLTSVVKMNHIRKDPNIGVIVAVVSCKKQTAARFT